VAGFSVLDKDSILLTNDLPYMGFHLLPSNNDIGYLNQLTFRTDSILISVLIREVFSKPVIDISHERLHLNSLHV